MASPQPTHQLFPMPPRKKRVRYTFNNPVLQTMQKDLRRITADAKRRNAASAASEKRLRALDKKSVNMKLDAVQGAMKSDYLFRVRQIKAIISSNDYLRKLKERNWVDQSVLTLECESSSEDEEDKKTYDFDVKAEKAKTFAERIINYKAFVARTAFDEYKDLKKRTRC